LQEIVVVTFEIGGVRVAGGIGATGGAISDVLASKLTFDCVIMRGEIAAQLCVLGEPWVSTTDEIELVWIENAATVVSSTLNLSGTSRASSLVTDLS